MKNPPTLADACIATALDKRPMFSSVRAKPVRELLFEVAHARKFVLDAQMSRFLAELANSFWKGGLRKRCVMLDNARQQARLPHALTWIEYSYAAHYLQRTRELGGQGVIDFLGKNPERFGWLMRQHPRHPAAFVVNEIRSSVNHPDRVFMHPLAMAWCADDEPSPWPRFPDATTDTSPGVVAIPGYHSSQTHFCANLGHDHVVEMLNVMTGSLASKGEMSSAEVDHACKPAVSLRALWALLSIINDLPVRIEEIKPSKGYIARGTYKRFLAHSVIHLTVPETRWRKLLGKTAALLRRRAHQVRGHLRDDWRKPPLKVCQHEWNAEMFCRLCGGHQLWVKEHERGDASLGFVTHDYTVHHDDDDKKD